MITQVKTPHPFVYRFDNVLSSKECLLVENYVRKKFPFYSKIDAETRPWQDNQNEPYNSINDIKVKKIINNYRFLTSQFIFKCFNQPCVPTFTDIVLWQEGREMGLHIDNGEGKKELKELFTRTFTSVLYINDGFKGGETIIRGLNNTQHYISKPKKGSIIIFTSDSKSEHKVNRVTKGNRITSSSWFTLNKQDIEL